MTKSHIHGDGIEYLSELDIPWHDDWDVRFHVETGRTSSDDPNKIDTTPQPDILVYDRDGLYHILVIIENTDPIVNDWFEEEPEDEEFLQHFFRSLDEGFNGISDITNIQSTNDQVHEDIEDSLSTVLSAELL